MYRFLIVLTGVLSTLVVLPAAAQHHASTSAPAMHLYDNLGAHHRPVTTTSAEAQRYFDQGMRLAFAFGRSDAAAAFREAQRLDPNCAMCYWGEAWSLGPYINEPLYDEARVPAHEAARKARSLAGGATPIEQALIDAMGVRYAPPQDAPSSDRASLDAAYADAMREVVRRFPEDLDATALHAEALMVLRPWDHWTADGGPQPGTEEALTVLESVLDRDLEHAAACHLYIHLVEASPRPERAEACADHLAAGIPGASHIQHMPSHIYMNVGRYADSVRRNQIARQMDQRAARGEAVAIYPEHNLHMLVFAGWMDGQSAVSLQAARDLARLSPPDAFYPVVVLARFGRWDEVLEVSGPVEPPFQAGMWSFARGLAHLRLDDADSSRFYRDRLSSTARATPDSLLWGFVGHRQADLLNIAAGILSGEVAASEGRFDEAVAALEEAIAVEDRLAYDEPEPWPLPSRHVLGAILLEADRAAEAERVYREALEIHPENGWSLFGLARSLTMQDKNEEAAAAWSRFDEAWARADVALYGSRF